jgi:hypothetical protein
MSGRCMTWASPDWPEAEGQGSVGGRRPRSTSWPAARPRIGPGRLPGHRCRRRDAGAGPRRRRAHRRRRRRAAAGRADRPQGHLRHQGLPQHRRLEDAGGLPLALRCHRGAQAGRGRRRDPGQAELRRVRHGLGQRELGLRPGEEPVGHEPHSRRLLGRQRRGGGRAAGAGRDRHRHRRLDPPAGRVLRHHRHQADLWPRSRYG